jgi:hypothetical protein
MTRLEAFEVAVYPLVVASTSVKVTVTTYEGDTYHIHLRYGQKVYSSRSHPDLKLQNCIDAAAFVVRVPTLAQTSYTASSGGRVTTPIRLTKTANRDTDLRCIRKLHRR